MTCDEPTMDFSIQTKMPPADDIEDTNVDYVGNRKQQKRRERFGLRLNYDSDSSDEDYKDNNTQGKPDNDGNDDDDDMFASEDEKGNKEATSYVNSKENAVAMLDMDEFERTEGIGQFDSEKANQETAELWETPGDDIDDECNIDYYTKTEDLDNDNVSKLRNLKKKEPKLEAFHLREEAEDGQFDAEGNYVRNNESDDEQEKQNNEDQWASDFSKSDIKKAQQAKLKREQKQAATTKQITPTEDLLRRLIAMLEPAETPMEALARLKPPTKKRNKKNIYQDDGARKQLVLDLTDICEQLVNVKLIQDIYDMSREELMRLYKRETGDDYFDAKQGTKRKRDDGEPEKQNETAKQQLTTDDYGEKVWQFRWIGDDVINGPYSNYEMKHWKETYFDNKVEVRKVGETQFMNVESVLFEDLDD